MPEEALRICGYQFVYYGLYWWRNTSFRTNVNVPCEKARNSDFDANELVKIKIRLLENI